MKWIVVALFLTGLTGCQVIRQGTVVEKACNYSDCACIVEVEDHKALAYYYAKCTHQTVIGDKVRVKVK